MGIESGITADILMRHLYTPIKGTQYVGRIVFFKEGSAIPPNASYPEPSIHYPLSRFNDVINILREEKPLYLLLNLTNMIGTLATSDIEPVGEEEGK